MTDGTKKARKQLAAVELYASDGDSLAKLALQPPPELKSADAMVRWLKKNAEIDGTYVFMRRIVGAEIAKTTVPVVNAKVF